MPHSSDLSVAKPLLEQEGVLKTLSKPQLIHAHTSCSPFPLHPSSFPRFWLVCASFPGTPGGLVEGDDGVFHTLGVPGSLAGLHIAVDRILGAGLGLHIQVDVA